MDGLTPPLFSMAIGKSQNHGIYPFVQMRLFFSTMRPHVQVWEKVWYKWSGRWKNKTYIHFQILLTRVIQDNNVNGSAQNILY